MKNSITKSFFKEWIKPHLVPWKIWSHVSKESIKPEMQDPLDVVQRLLACPFCQARFRDVAKCIPDCGKFICGRCYEDLVERVDSRDSREYECKACDNVHILSRTRFCQLQSSCRFHATVMPALDHGLSLFFLVLSLRQPRPLSPAWHACHQLSLNPCAAVALSGQILFLLDDGLRRLCSIQKTARTTRTRSSSLSFGLGPSRRVSRLYTTSHREASEWASKEAQTASRERSRGTDRS